MVSLWIANILPAYIISKLGPLSMIIAGLLVEKHYVGRISVFLNTFAINIYAYSKLNLLTSLEIWYCNIGLIVGIIGLLFYAFDEHLPYWYYTLAIAYSSVISGLYIFLT